MGRLEGTIARWIEENYPVEKFGFGMLILSILLMLVAAVNHMYLTPGHNSTGGCLVICVPVIAATVYHYTMVQQVLREEKQSKLPKRLADKSKEVYKKLAEYFENE